MEKPLAALLLLLLAACDDTPGKWSAYVYPDARDRSHWVRTDGLKSEAMCGRAAEESVARLPDPKDAAYKCVKLEPV